MIKPHGSKLVNRVLNPNRKSQILEEKDSFTTLNVDMDTIRDIENIAFGVYSPLKGFLGREDFESVLKNKRLSNGLPWTIPITLGMDSSTAGKIREGEEILLLHDNSPVALMRAEEKFTFSKEDYAESVYGTTDQNHPGVKVVFTMNDTLLSGDIKLIAPFLKDFEDYYMPPQKTREEFRKRGWKTIAAFQTRNIPHLGHEYVQKAALTLTDGLFINPLIGPKKPGDFTDRSIIDAYNALIKHYYPRRNVVMSILRSRMHYAGPREAIHHAIMRKNFGCTHFVVGRDHAGVGDYYHPFAAHDIFKEFPDLGIEPLFFGSFSHCTKCNAIVNDKTCPHPPEDHINFSGTKIRKMLSEGKYPPEEMMRPEVVRVILNSKQMFVE